MTRMFAIIVALLTWLTGVVTHVAEATRDTHAHLGPALVVGDSLVERAALAERNNRAVKLVGYSGQAPSGQLESDYAAAGSPRTVVLNWNGNNPDGFPGLQLVGVYRTRITSDIRWYLDHGVTTIVLAAAVPSGYNCGRWQISWTSSEAAVPGTMLGSYHFNDLYKELARAFPGKVFYSEKAARAIHPGMTCSPMLNGHLCIADYIHPTPYCAAIYARALEGLAAGGPVT